MYSRCYFLSSHRYAYLSFVGRVSFDEFMVLFREEHRKASSTCCVAKYGGGGGCKKSGGDIVETTRSEHEA